MSRPRLLAFTLCVTACNPSAFDDVEKGSEGGREVDASTDAGPGDGETDSGAPGPCSRPSSVPLSLTSADVEELAVQAEPPGVTFRVPGPSAWLGSQRTFLFGATHTDVAGVANDPYPSAALEGANPPWTAPFDEVESYQLKERLDPSGVPVQLVPSSPGDAGFTFVPQGLLWSQANTQGGALFAHKVTTNLVVQEVWLMHLADGAHVVSDVVGPLFSGTDPLFATGAHRGQDYVKLYACEHDPAVADLADLRYTRCYVARVPLAEVADRSRYEAYRSTGDGQGEWDAALNRATPVLYGAHTTLSVGWNNYLGAYVAVHGKPFANKLVVQTAPAAEGPWTVQGEIDLPANEFPALSIQWHAGLSGCDDRLMVSYLAPSGMAGIVPTGGQVHYVAINLR